MNNLISIADISKQYKLSKQTIDKYVGYGLLEVVERKGVARYFDTKDVEKRMVKIQEYHTKGIPLHAMRELLEKELLERKD